MANHAQKHGNEHHKVLQFRNCFIFLSAQAASFWNRWGHFWFFLPKKPDWDLLEISEQLVSMRAPGAENSRCIIGHIGPLHYDRASRVEHSLGVKRWILWGCSGCVDGYPIEETRILRCCNDNGARDNHIQTAPLQFFFFFVNKIGNSHGRRITRQCALQQSEITTSYAAPDITSTQWTDSYAGN